MRSYDVTGVQTCARPIFMLPGQIVLIELPKRSELKRLTISTGLGYTRVVFVEIGGLPVLEFLVQPNPYIWKLRLGSVLNQPEALGHLKIVAVFDVQDCVCHGLRCLRHVFRRSHYAQIGRASCRERV